MKALNALRRAFDMHDELSSLKLMTEKTGSIIGALLKECNDLLNGADDAMVFLRVNQGSSLNANNVFHVQNCLTIIIRPQMIFKLK